MKMILTIYKDKKQVNEIITDDATEIYKQIASIFIMQNIFNKKTNIIKYYNHNLEIKQKHILNSFDNKQTIYIYHYQFENINI